jgi:hypothetical protein
MPATGEPVPDDEFVLRRVPEKFVDRERRTISIQVFLPTNQDTDGWSVYRASLRSITEVAEHGRAGKRYHVLRLSIRELKRVASACGVPLTVVTVAGDPDSGHALVPELNRAVYDAEKPRFKNLANELVAELARPGSALGELHIL